MSGIGARVVVGVGGSVVVVGAAVVLVVGGTVVVDGVLTAEAVVVGAGGAADAPIPHATATSARAGSQ